MKSFQERVDLIRVKFGLGRTIGRTTFLLEHVVQSFLGIRPDQTCWNHTVLYRDYSLSFGTVDRCASAMALPDLRCGPTGSEHGYLYPS